MPTVVRLRTRGSVISRTNGGDSIYHGLQARVERSFRNNFLYRATYTLPEDDRQHKQ